MSSINNTVKEIVLLDKQLHNKLKITGGSKDNLNNFSSKIKKNKKSIFITSIVTITVLHIIVIIKLIKSNTNNEIIGGNINEMIGGNIDNVMIGGKDALVESVKNNFKSITSINGLLLALKSVYDLVNNFMGAQFTLITKMIPFSIKYNINISYYLIIILSLIISIIIFYVFNYIIDRKITIPCSGCSESTIWFKCLPGTGKGSLVCSIQKAITKVLLSIYKIIKAQVDLLISLLKTIEPIIKNIINLVSNFMINVEGVISIDFSFFKLLENPIPSIPTASIPGVSIGKLLLCEGYPIIRYNNVNNCIYSNGKLKDEIGNGPILRTIFKILRIIVRVPDPPPFDFKFSGGSNQDIIFTTLLESIAPLDLNPIKLIATFINILIKTISLLMKVIISALKATLSLMMTFLRNTLNGVVEQIESIVNFVIQPVFIVTSIILGIPKKLFKIVTLVNKVGLGNIMLYNLFGGMLETIQDPILFGVMLTTIIITLTVLIVCPYIGIMYNSLSYTKYFIGLKIRILTFIFSYLKEKQLNLFTLIQKIIKEWLELLEKKI